MPGKRKTELFYQGLRKAKRYPDKKGAGYGKGYAYCTGDVCQRFYFLTVRCLYRKGKVFPDHRWKADAGTIEGLGDKASEAIEDAAKQGAFLSKDDFRQRTKVSKTVIDLMSDLGLLEGLPETNQLSLFDF